MSTPQTNVLFVGRCLGAAAHSEPPLLKGGGLLEKQDGGIHFNLFDSIPVGRDDSARRLSDNQFFRMAETWLNAVLCQLTNHNVLFF